MPFGQNKRLDTIEYARKQVIALGKYGSEHCLSYTWAAQVELFVAEQTSNDIGINRAIM